MRCSPARAAGRAAWALGLFVMVACSTPEPALVGGGPRTPPEPELGDDFAARLAAYEHQIDLLKAAPEASGPASLEAALALLALALERIPAGDGLGAVEASDRIRAAVEDMQRIAPHPALEAERARAALVIAAKVLTRAGKEPFPEAAGPARELQAAIARIGPSTPLRPVHPAWTQALGAAARGLDAIRAGSALVPVFP